MKAVLEWLAGSAAFGPWTFLFVAVLMGGAASMASGRALALSWRPLRHCLFYGALIALAAAFLHYALFQQAVISLADLWQAAASLRETPGAAIAGLAEGLRGFAILFALETGFTLLGYRMTRTRQMAGQYGFACEAAGWLRWRERNRT